MPHLTKTLLILLVLLLCAVPLHAARLDVITSFSILADLTRQVGGDRVNVVTLIDTDEDAHGFQPRPSDARAVREADLIVANGLGFDAWIERLAQSAGYSGPIVTASAGVTALDAAAQHDHGHDHSRDHGDGHAHDNVDPHAWQDIANARVYVENIAAALAQIDPDGAQHYRDNAGRYAATLAALDAEIRRTLSALPPLRRTVVTSHDAFGYFERAYDIRFLPAAGIGSHSEPSAAGIARLIRQLRREKVPVVFIENVKDPRLIERISNESGAHIGGTLYSDALSGPDGPAPTYVDMMRLNLDALMTGLAGDRP